MPLTLAPLAPEDASRYMQIRLLAFAPNINNILYTKSPDRLPSAQTQAHVASHMQKQIASAPNVTFLKVTDDATGEIIAVAKWVWYGPFTEKWDDGVREQTDEQVEEDMRIPSCFPESDPDVFKNFVGMLHENRLRIMGKRSYYMLEVLVTHPEHNRRGAGTLLLEWGIKESEKRGVDAYLEATAMGVPLYVRYGFEKSVTMIFDLAEFGYEGKYPIEAMLRPAKATTLGH